MVGCLPHFGDELFNLGDFGAVGWDGDGAGVRIRGRQGVESFTGFGAGFGFAGGDVDFGAAGLDEAGEWAGRLVVAFIEDWRGRWGNYPDAAWSPRPLEPPVTTATFPSREKMFLKSSSLTWAAASEAIIAERAMVLVRKIRVVNGCEGE